MYYVPINAHDRSYIKALIAKEKAEKLLEFYKREAEAAESMQDAMRDYFKNSFHAALQAGKLGPAWMTYNKARANRIALETE